MTARLLFAAAVAVQVLVLYTPEPPTGGVRSPVAAAVVHLVVFAAAVWTGRRAGLPTRLLAGAFAAHAGISEAIQEALLPERSAELADIAADLAGIVLGALLPRSDDRMWAGRTDEG
ncbi:MAG: VanZ family protein [Jiangellaceae bacterium]|nr:VanZ family protein [Jiangellaceae bacterium]